MNRKMVLGALIVVAIAFIGINALRGDSGANNEVAGAAMVDVTLPPLSALEKAGEAAFNENCASCHGLNAAGQDGVAPPLIHKIYEPSHHGDMSFVLAAKQGVRAHHWKFGDMPAIEGITDQEIASIIGYVRTVQRANGIN